MRPGLRAMGALRPEEQGGQEPVALETAVLATGARPGDSVAKRQLFTEETQTVLVFENGAVIRLSAAVADGQLLFLTNKKTGKEVVTQVIRKRSFRPTSCYVDLEFTEPCPGFWGIEFPKPAALSPASLAEPEEQGVTSGPAAPDQKEVEKLKNEVAELQTKLKLLTNGQGSANTLDASVAPAVPDAETGAGEESSEQRQERAALQQLLAQESQQEQLHGPKRLVAYTRRSRANAVVKKAGKAATAGACVAVIVAAGVAAYRFGLLDSIIRKAASAKPVASQSASPALPPGSAQGHAAAASASSNFSTTGNTPSTARDAKPIAADKTGSTSVGMPQPSVAAESNVLNSVRSWSTANANSGTPSAATRAPKRGSGSATAGLAGVSAAPSSAVSKPVPTFDPASESVKTDDYIAPKLLHAVKPVSPPDALRNYVTGDVVVDAVVDSTGHVKSVAVISGPDKLRSTAINVMKQYVYEPAKKDGKAVPSHVKASLQFWYEP